MARRGAKVSKTAGLAPGALVHVGENKTDKVKITIIDYDEKRFQEKEAGTVQECFPFKDKPTVTWINIDGLQDVGVIEQLGEKFAVHSLVLEDILNTAQRPKYEDFGQYVFIALKMLDYDPGESEIKSEQVSVILGENFVISFQETEGDVFNMVRERIRGDKGRIRKSSADYLAYSLLDAVVDNYFVILERLGEKIEDLEEKVVSNPVPRTLKTIHDLKRSIISLRKSIWPLREVIGGLQRAESALIHKSTGIYLRDVYDHTIQVIDTVETSRDMVSGMLDIYLSSISNRMNEVMKVLTIIATIFIPITFVAGIYGMNFNPAVSPWNMPELNWRFGYIFVLGIMLSISLGMVMYFKRKKWL